MYREIHKLRNMRPAGEDSPGIFSTHLVPNSGPIIDFLDENGDAPAVSGLRRGWSRSLRLYFSKEVV
jgi:hypothetical protein